MITRFDKEGLYKEVVEALQLLLISDDKKLNMVIRQFVQNKLGNSEWARKTMASIALASVTRVDKETGKIGLSDAQRTLAFKILFDTNDSDEKWNCGHTYTTVYNFAHLVGIDIKSEEESLDDLTGDSGVSLPNSEEEDLPY